GISRKTSKTVVVKKGDKGRDLGQIPPPNPICKV
ncbi:unnamed protein product, partial [marine sediment metagenome]